MREIYSICLVIFSWMLSYSTWAADSLFLRSESSSLISFEAQTRVRNEVTPYATWKSKQFPTQKSKEKLAQLADTADWSFTNEPPDIALQKYMDVLDIYFDDQWTPKHRKIFFSSALRAAHLSRKSEKMDIFIHRAIQFYDGQGVDTDIFPPPVTTKFRQKQKDLLSEDFKINSQIKKFDLMQIKGKTLELKDFKKFRLPKAQYLISLYSSTYKSQSMLGSLEEIANWKPKLEKLVAGDCEKHTFSVENPNINGYIYFADDCIASFGNQKPLPLNLHPVKAPIKKKMNPLLNSNQLNTKLESKPWWKNRWGMVYPGWCRSCLSYL